MTRYVLICALVTIVLGAGLFAASLLFDLDLGNGAGHGTTLAGIGAGAGWFGHDARRQMTGSERLWFAAGAVLVNILWPIAFAVGLMLYFDIAVDMGGLDLLLSGGKGYVTWPFLIGIFAFVCPLIFIEGYWFGGLLTRAWSRRAPTGTAR